MDCWAKLENTDNGAKKGFCIGLGAGVLTGLALPCGLLIGVWAGMTFGTAIGALIGLYRDYMGINKDYKEKGESDIGMIGKDIAA